MRTLIITIFMTLATSALAQESLMINNAFEFIPESDIHNEYVRLTGESLKQANGITLFMSLTVSDSPKHVKSIRDMALVDGEKATEKKTIVRDGETVACYFQLPPAVSNSNINRFILYRKKDDNCAILIYMEGTTTLDELVKIKLNNK